MPHLICFHCHEKYPIEEPRWKCQCGHYLDLHHSSWKMPSLLELQKRPSSLWKYREAIPLERDENCISFGEGMTPLVKMEVEKKWVSLKLEQNFPSGSYKDRGATVLMSKAKELSVSHLVEDSSGNAGCAIASYAALAGMECHIYVPSSTSPSKLSQIQSYGAHLHLIPGSREDTAEAAEKAAQDSYYASHTWNPFFLQGTKTFAYEVWEQMGGEVPHSLVLPVGNGTLLLGAFLGFQDLLEQKRISKMPQIIAVQAENCSPLEQMWREKKSSLPLQEWKATKAEGIAIARPLRFQQILNAVDITGGNFLTVREEEISEAQKKIGALGLYVEPTAAAAVAGFLKLKFSSHQNVVVPLTGHGLKSK